MSFLTTVSVRGSRRESFSSVTASSKATRIALITSGPNTPSFNARAIDILLASVVMGVLNAYLAVECGLVWNVHRLNRVFQIWRPLAHKPFFAPTRRR